MTSHFTHFVQRFYTQQVHADPVQQRASSGTITTELEDLRKFSLNSLMAFLAILAAPKALQPAVLTLLLYTNSLRISNTCSLYNHLTLSSVLHVIPLLFVSCMACIQLVSAVQSPTLAAVALLSSVSPIAIHFGGQLVAILAEASAPALPLWVQRVVVPATSSCAESGQANGS